ncbi:CoB--CoM heterodisulfide reductase iron-sulfur subunit A family protein [Candidatus Bathyarchaeota archaeon]|nr:MAG: CoB--CoM heterodisulfide reductase iron-sulfur subunit A family protein [Candidatus Bathyarchaeota archaeon]
MTEEELRIGVFICHCGINIGGVVRVPEVVEYAKTLPGVVYAADNLYTCSAAGLDAIKKAIKEHRLNRVVVASCTPRTHEPLFRKTCEEAGLNKYLFEMANIREHCSWVHMDDPDRATEKAKDIVRMAVAKARLLEPLDDIEIEVRPEALVIGAGPAGMTAALSLANQGFHVYLVEKEPEVGGMLRKLNRLYPTDRKADELLQQLSNAVYQNSNIEVFTSTKIVDVSGFIGNFEVLVRKDGEERKLEVGTIIVATGAEPLKPTGLYGYGELEGVITQIELEERLKEGRLGTPKAVVMIQCVGSRIPERPYCSRICCATAIKNAILIKQASPQTQVYILYRDLQAYGKEYEEYYRRAQELGVRFISYTLEKPPEVSRGDGGLKVKVYHAVLGRELTLPADLVVLSTPLIPPETNEELSKLLKVPLDRNGFFLEAHVKLRPVDFATDGIYVCGTAHSPKDVPDSIAQAYAAASRASIPMANRRVVAEGIVAEVNKDRCIGCALCVDLCPFKASRIGEDGKAEVIKVLCKGCGVCAASCPQRAITMKNFTDSQILAQVEAAFKG